MDHSDWVRVLSFRKWCPLSESQLSANKIADPLFHVRDDFYLTLSDYNFLTNTDVGGPFITSLLWAVSQGAARRAITRDIEADIPVLSAHPPAPLLPGPSIDTYGELLLHFVKRGRDRRIMERASYRGTDGIFICRTIDAHPWEFMFRKTEDDNSEMPFAVSYSLIGK